MDMRDRFKKLVEGAHRIVVTTHFPPDADGIGGQVALSMGLQSLGKDCVCVNEAPLLERYSYLDPKKVLHSYEEYQNQHKNKDIDLLIVADTNSLDRIGPNAQALYPMARELLFIDHHPAPEKIVSAHCIDTSMAATGELVGHLLESLGVKLTADMALPLYTAILIDTSSFRYPTVSGNTHRFLAKLLDAGVRPPKAYNFIYGTKKIGHMQLLGKILSKAQTTPRGDIAWIVVKSKDLKKFHVSTEDTHSFINNLLILDNLKVACMFRQEGTSVKVSLRSAGEVNVGAMAEGLGGGGHNHSAATVVEGELDNVVESIVQKIDSMLKS